MQISFAGCAGNCMARRLLAGSYQITVTSASATVQAIAPVTLIVQ